MNKRDRHNILSNIDKLAQQIDFNSDLVNQMINKNIFNQRMVEDIKKISDKMEQNKRFLFDMCRRGPEAYDQFVKVLYGTGQVCAVRILRPDYFAKTSDTAEIVEKITSSPETHEEPISLSGQDTGDHQSLGTVSNVENDDYMINVKRCLSAFDGVNIYPMKSNPRGFTLIFNNYKFEDNKSYPERLGSQSEANRLRDVFTQLHFNVKVFDNLKQNEIKKTLEEYRREPELKRHDCLIVIVLSHGFSGYCLGSDGRALPFEDIVQKFNNENCPQLIGCPKLFFFSCCRGECRDSGPKFRFNGEKATADAKSFSQSIQPIIPTTNDMMICYSTVDGYVSWRNEENGSWFGTALAQSLMRYAHQSDLNYILTNASAMVTTKTTENGEKQVMEHTFRGFTKMFYFNPGIIAHSTISATQ